METRTLVAEIYTLRTPAIFTSAKSTEVLDSLGRNVRPQFELDMDRGIQANLNIHEDHDGSCLIRLCGSDGCRRRRRANRNNLWIRCTTRSGRLDRLWLRRWRARNCDGLGTWACRGPRFALLERIVALVPGRLRRRSRRQKKALTSEEAWPSFRIRGLPRLPTFHRGGCETIWGETHIIRIPFVSREGRHRRLSSRVTDSRLAP